MFKVGDKVIVKTREELLNTKGVIEGTDYLEKKDESSDAFVDSMEECSGKVFEIEMISKGNYPIIYLKGNKAIWNWNEWMLKPFSSQLELFDV